MHTGAFRGTEVPGWFQPTFAVIAVMAALPIQAQTLNRNLVVNGGAENGAAVQAIGDPQVGQVPGWTVTGPFSVGTYDVSEFPSSTDYGPTDRGAKLFYGGSGTDHSYATQLIDLSGASSEIDGGKVKFYFSGYIGSGGAVPANIQQAFLKAEFLNGSGVTLLTAVAPGPKFEEDDGVSNMMLREITGFLPPNIRTVRVTVDLATADSGSYNTLAADNISLVLATESLYGVNLLVNGDAETNPDQIDFANDKPVAGWNVHSQITVGTWGDYNFPSATDPGPPDRGQYFFICWGDRAADNRAYQFVDISAAKQMIDSGQVSYKLSGWFGSGQDGDTDSPDNADLQVAFYDASGNGLPGLQVGPVTAQDRNGQIGMFQRSGSGTVPVGARLARIDLNFNRLTQDVTINTNAYADSLSFVLTNATPPSIGGIISLGDFGALPNFTSGSLIEIYGSNLATSRRKWSGADFNGSNAPTSLDGTSVTVNNKSAFVAFISPEQVNVQVPDGVGTDSVPVVVTTAAGSSNVFTVKAMPTAAGMLAPAAFKVNGKHYVAAFVGPDYQSTFALPAGAISGVPSRPARPNEEIVIYGVGFGPVTPDTPAGVLPSGATTLTTPLQATIGGAPATATYHGLSGFIGIYQVQLVVPAIADNDAAPLNFTLGGVPGAQTLYIAVKQQ